MSDETKKSEENKGASEPTTVDDMYKAIDQKVQQFAVEFLNFLPKSPAVSVNIQIIADRLVTIKESAKLLVNNYVVDRDKKKEETK